MSCYNVPPQSRLTLKCPITLGAVENDSRVNASNVNFQRSSQMKHFSAQVALVRGIFVVSHVMRKISWSVEDFSADFAWDVLFRCVNTFNVNSE
jgi:hypothetical protein